MSVGARRGGRTPVHHCRLHAEILEDRTVPSFTLPEALTAGVNPVGVAVADLNGDGLPDLVVANYGKPGIGAFGSSVSVFLGTPNGAFKPPVNYLIGLNPQYVVIGDFNGDKKLDVMASVRFGAALMLGKGDGTFGAPTIVGDNIFPTQQFLATSLRKNGILDLAVLSQGQNQLQIFLGNGDGTFQDGVTYATGTNPDAMVIGDFNGDGSPDIAVANAGSNTVSVFLNGGGGGLGANIDSAAGTNPTFLASADFNGDKKADLAVMNSAGGSVLLGNGDGSLKAPVNLTPSPGLRDFNAPIVTGDFNGDGKADVVIPGIQAPTRLFMGNANGTFRAPVDYATGLNLSTPLSVGTPEPAVADLLKTKRSDLIIPTATGVLVTFSNAGGVLRAPAAFQANSGVSAPANLLATADFNGDGKADLVTVTSLGTSVVLSNGNGTFKQPALLDSNLTTDVAVGDVNNDGKPDIVVLTPNSLDVFLGNGDGTFQSAKTKVVGGNPSALTLGMFGSNGKMAIALTDALHNYVNILTGNGDGTFSIGATYAAGIQPCAIVPADLNGDGKTDLAVASVFSNNITVLLSNGNGTFAPGVTYGTGQGPIGLAVADLNGDNHPDIVTADALGSDVSILLGNGNGTFKAATAIPLPNQPSAIVAADFNGDGASDLAVGLSAGADYSVMIFLGEGNGKFLPPKGYSTGHTAVNALAAADFNGDGASDLAVAASSFPDSVGVALADPATKFAITAPAAATAGIPFSVTVTALDALGQRLLDYYGTAHFSSSDTKAILPPDYTFTTLDSGKHTFTNAVTLNTAGSETLTVADKAHPSVTGTVTITVSAGPMSLIDRPTSTLERDHVFACEAKALFWRRETADLYGVDLLISDEREKGTGT
jgi:hypothetical protein